MKGPLLRSEAEPATALSLKPCAFAEVGPLVTTSHVMPKSPSKKAADLEIAIADASRGSGLAASPTRKARGLAGRIMYIECKAGGLTGIARIGRVTFSKTGRTLYYGGQTFQSLKGAGFKSNFYCVETGEDYWISGPKQRGGDALYGGSTPIEIDEDVREEYWQTIRRQPERVHETMA